MTPVRENVGRLISHTSRQWRRAVDVRLQPYGLTEATWLPLLHIARAAEPMRQKDIAASMSLDSSSVVRLLDALQSSGLIERREEASDRRAKTIALTRRGQSTVAQVEAVSSEVRSHVLAGISDKDLAIVTRVLQQMCRSLSETTETVA